MAEIIKQIEQVLNKLERIGTLLNTGENQKNTMKCHLFILFVILHPKFK